jgi:hypothetical protein
MSIEEAAGFAMAPSEDDVTEAVPALPDEALRNGHITAAARSAQHGPAQAPTPLIESLHGAAWLRELLTGWWAGGKAHA